MSKPFAGGSVALAALLILRGPVAHAQSPSAPAFVTLTVHSQPVARRLRAYGEVQFVALTQVHAVQAGVLGRLALPGERVASGEVLAVLRGAQAQSLLAERRGALRAASIQLAADRRRLAAQLVTRQTLAADAAAYEAARARLKVALEILTLRAPAAGRVLSVAAADGEQVGAGQLILTLQTGRPWLEATYYGAEALAIRPGMSGRFHSLSGAAVAVRVRSVSRALEPDGGEAVWLVPASSARRGSAARAGSWRSGEWGTVTLLGASRPMVPVPTRALILDRARWWVLVRTPRGFRRQIVVPGPTRGWNTFIERGLEPGDRVIVENAYLEFHRGIAERYTPPD